MELPATEVYLSSENTKAQYKLVRLSVFVKGDLTETPKCKE
jgi:hypothetical protein